MKYALIIGNNKYDDPKLAQLKTPAADSQALAKVLADKNIGSFDEVTPLVNKTETEIRRAISGFLTNKKPDDLVLVYFSGHGVLDDRGRLFLSLKDTQTDLLKATAIPSTFISDEMDSCRSKRQILILDCCHSGAFARGTKGEQKAVTEATFEGSGYGRVVMTASDSTQYALEGDQVIRQTDLSLFTHFLLEGLKTGEADTDNDGHISLDEWYDYTYAKVISETPNQIPHRWSYNQQGDLIIARNPNARKRVVELPFELVQASESPFTSIRESAVNEFGKLLQSRDPELANLARLSLEKMKEDDSRRIASAAANLLSEFEKLRTPIRKSVDEPNENVKMQPVATEGKLRLESAKANIPLGMVEASRETPVEITSSVQPMKTTEKSERFIPPLSNTQSASDFMKTGARRNIFLLLLSICLLSAALTSVLSALITAPELITLTSYSILAILVGLFFVMRKEVPRNFGFITLAIYFFLDGINSFVFVFNPDLPLVLFTFTGFISLASGIYFVSRRNISNNLGSLMISGYLISISLAYFGITNLTLFDTFSVISSVFALPAAVFLFLGK